MVNPVSNSQAVRRVELARAVFKKPAPEAAPKSQPARVQDSVSLKSSGDADRDGDSK